MQPQQIPFVKLNFFEKALPHGGKTLLRILVGVAVLATLFFLTSYLFPHLWVGDVVPVSDSRPAWVQLQHTEAQYRDMEYVAQAYYNFTTFAATTLEPSATLVFLFLIFQLIGWSAILAAASNIQGGLHSYAIYILFGAQIYLAGMAPALFGADPFKLLTLLLGLFFILPAYLFKSRYIDWGYPRQFVVFVALHIVYYAAIGIYGGIPLVHQAVAFPFYVHILLGVLLVVMLSKDLGNLLILLLNNHKQIERRRNPILLYTLYALFIVLLGLSALEANEMVPQGTVGFRVPWLMALLAPITVYLAQNGFGQLRDTIPSNLAYNLLILGIVILGLGVWGYHIGQAEYSLRAWLDRVASNIFFFVTLGHFIYTAINFNGLLKQRSLVYYVLYQPKLFRFYPFWIFAVLVVGLVEAAIHPLKAELHLRTVNRNIQADNMLFLGHINYAVTIFSDVSNQMYGDVKSSFNAAQLMLGQPEVLQSRTKQDIVIDHYRRAQLRFTFPEAGINLGIFLQLTNRNGEAGLQLRESANAFHDDRLWVNLAALYQLANQPDSVIALLKRAGEINPSNAAIFSNLAATYWAYGRPELAREFILTAHSIAPNAPYVLENYYYYHLAHDTSRIQLPATIDTLAANYTYTVNKALLALRQGDANTADAICRSLAGAEPSDALVLTHLLAQLRLDSLDNALSRLSWIGQHHPNVAPMAFHDVGVFFAEHKVPEMAMGYFNSASQMGSLPDSALAAGMLADMGYLAQAYEMYAALQNLHPNQNAIQELTRREKAMLDFAAGTETIYIGWNFQDITQNEALRLARYCGFTHNLERATKALEMCVAKDSADIRPYLELANIELQRGDSADLGFALAQVEAGIQHVNAQHPTALLLKARLQAKLNNTTQAAQTLAQVVVAPPDSTDWALAQASLLAAQGQAPAAIATLQAAHSRNPLNPEIIALAVKLMRQSNQAYDAYLFLSKAIDFNRRNRSYWMTLAELQTELGRHQEAVETYQMALSLSILPSEVAQVKALRNQAEQRAFAQEVQVYQSVTPSN